MGQEARGGRPPTGAPGRGRRVILPDDERARTPRETANARVAWLLVTNRLLGADAEFTRRQPFIAALAERGRTVDASTLSRWEAGQSDLTDQTANLYEDVLGLAPGSLVAVTSGVRRALGVGPTSPARVTADPELLNIDLEPLVDRVSAGLGTGGDWLALTRRLGAFDLIRMRHEEWARLSHRMIDELGTSVGFAFVRRYEAAVDLLARPEAVHHLTEAIASFVTPLEVQRVFPVLALLAEIDNDKAGAVATQLLDSDNPVVRWAAAWTVVAKLARNHEAGINHERLEAHIGRGLRLGDSLIDRLDSANLAIHLPDASWARLRADLGAVPEIEVVNGARARGELVIDERVRSVVEDMASTVVSETPAPVALGYDAMLRRLLREAVLDPDSARRHQAMVTIAASPYSTTIARHARSLAHTEYPVLAVRMQELLIQLGDVDPGGAPLENALAESREGIRARALIAIGVRPSVLPARDDALLVDHTVTAEAPMDRAAGLFALGMSGSESIGDLEGHDELGAAARWWTANGPALHDSDVVADDPA